MLSGIKYVVSFGAFYFGDLIRQAKQNLVNNGLLLASGCNRCKLLFQNKDDIDKFFTHIDV
jgi:hypothetical protein